MVLDYNKPAIINVNCTTSNSNNHTSTSVYLMYKNNYKNVCMIDTKTVLSSVMADPGSIHLRVSCRHNNRVGCLLVKDGRS